MKDEKFLSGKKLCLNCTGMKHRANECKDENTFIMHQVVRKLKMLFSTQMKETHQLLIQQLSVQFML